MLAVAESVTAGDDAGGGALTMRSRLLIVARPDGQEILDGISLVLQLLDSVETNSAVARHVPRITDVIRRPVHRHRQRSLLLAAAPVCYKLRLAGWLAGLLPEEI